MNQPDNASLDEMADEVRSAIHSQRRRGSFGRVVWITGGIMLLALIVWWLWPQTTVIEWETRAVDRGDMALSATATGNLEPRSEVTVGAEISGLIREVLVIENDPVAVDDVLARFDTEELEVNLAQAEARLALAQASVAEAEATLEETTIDERRLNDLMARNMTSQAELDTARAAVKRAAARVRYSEASVREAQAAVSASRTRLDKAVITSPIKGVVLKRNIEPGNTVAASFQAPELFILAEDLREMELHVSLDEADVGLVRPGQPTTFTVDAWPAEEFAAEVLSVYLYPTIENNVVTYTTVLGVDNPDEKLLPGMTATATITTGEREQVIRVPNMALRFQPPGDEEEAGGLRIGGRRRPSSERQDNAVWLLRDGQPERIPVRTGYSDGVYTEILGDALSPGDEVVVGMREK